MDRAAKGLSGRLGIAGLALAILASAAAAAPDPGIRAVLDGISEDSLRATVTRLSAYRTRFVGTDSNRAAGDWLRGRLLALGYGDARFDSFSVTVDRTLLGKRFTLTGVPARNVLASRRGVMWPERVVVLGAHYDTINIGPPGQVSAPDTTTAPGANDNATGVAVILEMARLLRSIETDVTVQLALFDAEELGLLGSGHFAGDARARGDDVRAMFSIDALGARDRDFPRAFTIDATSRSASVAQEVAQAALDYTPLAPRSTSGTGYLEIISSQGREGCNCSDHQSFTDRGYPGVGVFQYFGADLVFHTSRDTLGGVDFPLVSGIGKAALGASLRIAGFPGRSPDFDASGVVDLSDFFLFAARYGLSEGAVGYEARFDLDRSGDVGIEDFFLFAARFGSRT